MSFMYFEGTKDYVAATPALLNTFEASGSITAGRFLNFVSATDQRVFVPLSTYQGAGGATAVPAGLALATVATGDACPVLVWGYAKNIAVSAAQTNITGFAIVSGAGYLWNSGSTTKNLYNVAKIISGSATSCVAFINCMP